MHIRKVHQARVESKEEGIKSEKGHEKYMRVACISTRVQYVVKESNGSSAVVLACP